MVHAPVPRRLSSGLSVLASVVLAAAPLTPPERPEHWPRLALDAGTLYLWDRDSAAMSPIPPGPIPAGNPPLAIADAGDGRGVLLARAATEGEGQSRKRSEGEALLLAWGDRRAPDRGLTLAWTSRFEGLPRAAAVASSRAWVLTGRAATSETAPERLWLHELDRTSGRIEDSTLLAAPAAALAADPLGRRVFLALEGRILSLTTRPLVTSWHYRSPGANRALAISPSGAVLASLRGRELALFDAAAIARRSVEARRSREDDATTVIPLPLDADEIAFSEDDRLVALFGKEGCVFAEIATGALILTESKPPAGAARLHPIDFPGADRLLVVAAFPAGEVVSLPAPAIQPAPRAEVATILPPPPGKTAPEPIATSASAPPGAGTPETGPPRVVGESAPTVAGAPPPASEGAAPSVPALANAPTDTAPTSQAPTALEPAPAQGTAPAPGTAPARTAGAAAPAASVSAAESARAVEADRAPEGGPAAPSTSTAESAPAKEPVPETAPAPAAEPAAPPGLSGRITGDRARVRAIVLYGPNSIIREHARVIPDAAGAWLIPLPPAGTYRVVPVGDGSTPIAVAPGFLTVVVTAGERRAGLDFEAGAVR